MLGQCMYSYTSCTELQLASCMVNAIVVSCQLSLAEVNVDMCLLLAVFDVVVIAVENCGPGFACGLVACSKLV